MNFKNKFLSLVGAVSLIFGANVWNQPRCSAMDVSGKKAKAVFLGDTGVGKTSILNRLVKGDFNSDQPSTIGAQYVILKENVEGTDISIEVWDTAGQERFEALAPMYIRESKIVILVFDLSDENKEKVKCKLDKWIAKAKSSVESNACFILVGNKSDLCEDSDACWDRVETLAKNHNISQFFVCSAKSGENIENLKNYLFQCGQRMGTEVKTDLNFIFTKDWDSKPKKKSCCK